MLPKSKTLLGNLIIAFILCASDTFHSYSSSVFYKMYQACQLEQCETQSKTEIQFFLIHEIALKMKLNHNPTFLFPRVEKRKLTTSASNHIPFPLVSARGDFACTNLATSFCLSGG